MNVDWKTIVKNVAPAIGTALGGPIGGIATKFIADKFLGNPQASEQEIAQAINTATPEQLVKLKELDLNFQIEMGKQGVDLYALEVQDRDSARKRESAYVENGKRDWTPSILAFLLLVGFFGIVWAVMKDGNVSEADLFILGVASTNLGFALAYYFGSSNKDKKNENTTKPF